MVPSTSSSVVVAPLRLPLPIASNTRARISASNAGCAAKNSAAFSFP
jgi:hypothetical protein